jgi:uncharacterized protein
MPKNVLYNRGDLAAAYRLLRAAADRSDADAQVNLGYMYARGQVVPLDQREALRLYRLLAEQGNSEGMNALGYKYQYGTGVAADIGIAVQWYYRAVAHGNPRALNNLAILHRNGNGVPRDYSKARSLWQQAVDLGVSRPDAPAKLRAIRQPSIIVGVRGGAGRTRTSNHPVMDSVS